MSTNDAPETHTRFDSDDLQMRLALANALGNSFGGKRDLYDNYGWDESPSIEDYYARYLRNPYARTVVDAPAETAWRGSPDIVDDESSEDANSQSSFESDIETLADTHRLWHYGQRADRLAGIGEFGVLMIGFDDGEDFVQPVSASSLSGTDDINWLRPFSQLSVESIRLGGQGSGRWGLPLYYKLDLEDEDDDLSVSIDTEVWVHHDRVIHIAENLLDDEVRGTPRQEPVLNPLTDIEKTLGAAAEIAYSIARPGFHLNVAKDAALPDDVKDELSEQLQKFVHDLQPFIRTQGADIERISSEDVDPTPIINAEIEAIAAQIGMPQSVLKGNETGERASSEDLKEWYGIIQERREQQVTPVIVRELIDRFITFGVLSQPTGGVSAYSVDWPPLWELGEQEISTIQVNRSKVIKNIVTAAPGLGSEAIVEYINDGELALPDPTEIDPAAITPQLDETNPQVQQYMNQAFNVGQRQQQAAVTDGGKDGDQQ